MAITSDMARAELARRELAKRQQVQAQPQQEEEGGITSIPGDIGKGAVNLFMSAGEKAMQLPDEFTEAGEQLAEHPAKGIARAGGGIASGVLEGGKQLFNLPMNLASYLGKKGVPGFSSGFPFADSPNTLGQLAEKLKIGDTGLQKAVMGEPQKGDQLWQDIGEIAPLIAAPETIGAKIPAVTSKGLIKQLSKEKAKQLGIAKQDYSDLFREAAMNNLTHAIPAKTVTKNTAEIVKNSIPKYHTSLKKYIETPTIENAHWAQSELGALQRHLDKISQKTGLTPSQVKTYKAVKEARSGIKKSMFSENAFGKNPGLALKYENLGTKYKENVIPYTSLEDLSEFEAGRMRPKTAVKNLLNDEEFMINLSKKYPGIYLQTPFAKKLGWGAAGLLGYDELKKLIG